MVEEMMAAGLPVVIVDPVGVWWGLRSSATGTAEGLPVVIFGGDHADLPLAETAGELLADLVVDERVPAVLDLSTLSKSAGRRFMTDFAERLYHRNRDPLHLVLDEADAFAPQRTDPGGQRLLGAIEDLVRRGRARGIGVTLITQRPAVLANCPGASHSLHHARAVQRFSGSAVQRFSGSAVQRFSGSAVQRYQVAQSAQIGWSWRCPA